MTRSSSPIGAGEFTSTCESRGGHLSRHPTPLPRAGSRDPHRRALISARRNTLRRAPGRLALSGIIALAVVTLGSCDSSTALEVDEYCAAARDVLLAQVPARIFAEFQPNASVLVVEESTAPGCQPWDWNGDHTACINATLKMAHDAGTNLVGLTRGQRYRYSDRIYVLPHTALGAVGDPARDRPVLATSELVSDGIAVSSGAEIRNLDIRGPHYNTTNFLVKKHGDWLYKGINGATSSGWSILGTSVNGFVGTGILAARSHDIRIEGSTFSHNGYSGVSLFQGDDDCGRGVLFIGNLVEYNGQDGIDTCSSDARYANNTIRHNGWDQNGGDRHGLLVFAWSKGGAERIEIIGNKIYGNGESGIRVSGNLVSDIVIRGNYLTDNGHWGLDPGAPDGRLDGVDVRDNSCGRNRLGCLNRAYLSGVAVMANSCFK